MIEREERGRDRAGKKKKNKQTHEHVFHGIIQRLLGCTPRGSCNNTRLLEGFLEGSLTVSAS